MQLTRGIIQVDLNNDLAKKYLDLALKSWERVSDIFEIEVIQCVTPDSLLEELSGIPDSGRSPQELASIHSNYRAIKRMSEGDTFWAMEHDAYLRPEHEDTFRMLMSKWENFPVAELGMANEFYTMWPEIAVRWMNLIKQGWKSGPMGALHRATDLWCKNKKWDRRVIYWPLDWSKDPRWVNMTGVSINVGSAYRDPFTIINSPVTQIVDRKYGGTVTDRPKQLRNGVYDISKIYNFQLHPDVQWVDLDSGKIL